MRTSNKFKRECRKYYYYISQIELLNSKIRDINHILTKPNEPKLEVIGQPAKNVDSKIVSLITYKIQIEKEIEDILITMAIIEKLHKLPKPWNDILWKNLVDGVVVEDLLKEYGITRSTFYRRMRYFISRNLHV